MGLHKAQVYIATTKGLVQVQAITPLSNPILNSVVTVNKSVQLAGISEHYQAFVEKPQGIIHKLFGGHGYRMNVSAEIDTGNSWQLGTFVAHCLYNADTLSEADTDIIFIATGAIDTLNHLVTPVNALAQKCLVSQSKIKQWQKEGKQLFFFVPTENFRQPLPDVQINLTPVSSLKQVQQLLHTLNLTSAQHSQVNTNEELLLCESRFLETNGQTVTEEFAAEQRHFQDAFADENNLTIEAHEQTWWSSLGLSKTFSKAMLLVFTGLVAATLLLFLFIANINAPEEYRYWVEADFSQNRATCSQVEAMVISQGDLSAMGTIQPSLSQNLCELRLVTLDNISDIWLIGASGQVSPLLGFTSGNNDTLVWKLTLNGLLQAPLSKDTLPVAGAGQFLEQYLGQYYILLFPHKMDAADLQTLQNALKNNAVSASGQNLPSFTVITNWARFLDIEVFLLSHEIKT